MVTEESVFRKLIFEVVKSKGESSTHTNEIYDYIESQEKSGRLRFDQDELSPIGASNPQPKWRRNVRNGYGTLKEIGDIAHLGNLSGCYHLFFPCKICFYIWDNTF